MAAHFTSEIANTYVKIGYRRNLGRQFVAFRRPGGMKSGGA
jgi:hypothetical protein